MKMTHFFRVIVFFAFLQSTGNARYLLMWLEGDYSVANPGPSETSTKCIIFFEHDSQHNSISKQSINHRPFSYSLGITKPIRTTICSAILAGAPCPNPYCDWCALLASIWSRIVCCLGCCLSI